MNGSRWIELSSKNDRNTLDRDLVRAATLANADLATDGGRGRQQGDALFEEITEGRQRWHGYSSCGDLIHWSLRRLGLRDERILNREDDAGDAPWRVGRNISHLVYATGRAFRWWQRGDGFDVTPGDMLLIGQRGLEHVFIAQAAQGGVLRSFDYGQFFDGKHGGRAVTRHYQLGPFERFHIFGSTLPGRPFIGKLDLVALLEPYFLRGELEACEVPQAFDGGRDAAPPALPQSPLLSTRDIQRALTQLGFDPGPVDGTWGPTTRAAVLSFQRDRGLVADGVVGPKTRAAMREGLVA